MVQFWAHKEVVFVHCYVLQFAYCAVATAEDFDAMEVCCETVVTCVEPGICDCLFSGFVYNIYYSTYNIYYSVRCTHRTEYQDCLLGCITVYLVSNVWKESAAPSFE